MYTFPTRTRLLVAASTAVLTLSVAACGGADSSDSGGGSGGETDDAAIAAAQERLAPYLEPVEKIEVSTPLTRRPDPGKSIYSIRFNLPAPAEWDEPITEAGEALGWTTTVLSVDASDPQAGSNAVLRAVNEGADFIAVNSGSEASIGPGLDAARAAGIPVFLAAGNGEPQGEANGIYGSTYADVPLVGPLRLVDRMIVDSDGTGSMLLVNAPDFPVLTPIGDEVEQFVADNCGGCSIDVLNISAADLGGDTASNIVAAIRQNPDIKYVVGTFDGLLGGLPQALRAAGLDDVQVSVTSPTNASVEAMVNGDFAAQMVVSDQNRGWLLVDQMARQSLGMDVLQSEHGLLNMQLWTPDTVPDGETSWDPPNYEQQYKDLWQVS